MPDTAIALVIDQLRGALREGFEGPAGQRWTYFTDNDPNAGVFGTIDALTAEQASLASGPNGTTVAGHVNHLCFSVAATRAWLAGDQSPRDWSENWRVRQLDDAGWARLRAELWREYEGLARAVETVDTTSAMAVALAVGAVAHTAYHLGAVRQKIASGTSAPAAVNGTAP